GPLANTRSMPSSISGKWRATTAFSILSALAYARSWVGTCCNADECPRSPGENAEGISGKREYPGRNYRYHRGVQLHGQICHADFAGSRKQDPHADVSSGTRESIR